MTLTEQACELATLGWPVFPVNGKIPLIKNWPELASTDPEQLKKWWQQFPKANIGLVTGKRSGILVLDIDGAAGRTTLENLCQNNDELPQTLAATTGRGIHYYFKFPSAGSIGNAAGKLGHGVDVRGEGGFVVAPPSRHQSGQTYQWINPELCIEAIPNWLLDLLTPEPPPIIPMAQALPATPITENTLQRYGSAALTNAMQAVAGTSEGSRNHKLNLEAFNMGQLIGAGALSVTEVENCLLESAQVCGLSTTEARSALKSGLNAGIKRPRDLSHLKTVPVSSSTSKTTQISEEKTEVIKNLRLKPFSARELMNKEFKPTRWAIPNFLPEGLTILAGRPKNCKSWLAFELCIAVATGGLALGNQQARKGMAFYLALEDNDKRLQERFSQLSQDSEEPIDDLVFLTEAPRYNDGGLDAIAEWLDHHPDCRLVVLDTLGRFRPSGRQNGDSYTEDTILLGAMQKMALDKGIALVVIHHTRKSNPESHGGDPFDAVLGSTGLTGVADSIWILSKPRNESVGYLLMTSRDVPEQKLVIEFDDVACRWSLQVEPESLCRTVERQKIFDCLSKYDTPQGPKEMSLATGLPYESVRHLMRFMEAEGVLIRKSRGQYMAHTPLTNSQED